MLSSETLALRYRPCTFESVVGQRATKLILTQMVVRQKVPTGLLFTGPAGSGKTSLARILAAAMNCTAPRDNEPPPCGNCVHCKATFNTMSVDVLEVDAASHGSVAHIRELTESLRYSAAGNYRVLILDECHSMSREAYYALLKTLEEPPENTVFILLTTEPHKILETIHSRLMHFQFKKISSIDIVNRLTHISTLEKLDMETELLNLVAERAQGGLREAIMTLDQLGRIGIKTVTQFAKFTGESDYASELIGAMIDAQINRVFEVTESQLQTHGDSSVVIADICKTLREMLVAQAVPDVSASLGAAKAVRLELSGRVSTEALYRAIRLCWELEVKLAIRDSRSALDLLCVMLTETLSGKKGIAQEVKKAEPKKLTLDEMKMI